MDVRRWWATGQDPWVKFVELFLVANGVAAVLSLTLAPGSEDWFTWTVLPDAGARLLAVMYANAVLLGVIALRQPDWPHARAIFVLITFFALAATLMTFFNLDAVQGAPLVPPRLLARRLRGARAHRAVGPRPRGAPARRPAPGRAAAERRPARHRRARVRRDGRGGDRARDQPAGVLADLALGRSRRSPGGCSASGCWPVAVAYAWTLWDGDWRRARPLFLAAPVTGLLLALVPLLHQGDVRPDAAGELLVYYALAAVIAAPGLGLASAPQPARRAAA